MAELLPTIGMSGKFGTVNGLSTVSQWQISDIISDLQKLINTRTLGGTDSYAGNVDWMGNYVQDLSYPSLGLSGMPGSVITFIGYVGPGTGVLGGDGPGATAKAIIESMQIEWNWETNAPVQCTTNIAGYGQAGTAGAPDGVLRIADVSPYQDVSAGAYAFTPAGSFVRASLDGVTYANLCCSRAVLNITSQNQKFVNSCTSGLVGRRMGNVNWTLQLTMSDANVAENIPLVSPTTLAPGTIVAITLPALGGLYWLLEWGQVRNQTNFVVSRKTGQIIAYTVNIEMCAFDGSSNIGQIALPGGSVYWPLEWAS